MKDKKLNFALKLVSEKKVLKAIKSMKRKTNAGYNAVTHEQLIMGAEVLAVPLTRIFNTSITEGVSQKCRKKEMLH